MALQEYCKKIFGGEEGLEKTIQQIIDSDDNEKAAFKTAEAEAKLEEFFSGLKITQPSDYFLTHPTDDSDLASNIQTNLEFVLDTLTYFGLPEGYINGAGHHLDFGKEKDNKSMAAK